MKRLFDIIIASLALLVLGIFLLPILYLIWRQDKHSPFYIAPRVGMNEKPFKLIKLRSMCYGADKSGVDSTSANDMRITKVGHFIRRYKLDEIPQFWNVIKGDMSLVGPRPNVKRETDLYTKEEKKLLTVRPGITGISSIVFSDEGEILENKDDPDIAYNQLIRPWKSRLGIFYIENRTVGIDFKLLYLTAVAIVSRKKALLGINKILKKLKAPNDILEVSLREKELQPTPPPGMDTIVTSRD